MLGIFISDDLKWDLNTQNLVKKANLMALLRKLASFETPHDDLKIFVYF